MSQRSLSPPPSVKFFRLNLLSWTFRPEKRVECLSGWREDIFTAGSVTTFTAQTISFCVDLWRRRVSRNVWEIRSCLRGYNPGFRRILRPSYLSQVSFCTLSLQRRDSLNSKGPQFFIFTVRRLFLKTRLSNLRLQDAELWSIWLQQIFLSQSWSCISVGATVAGPKWGDPPKVPDRSAWPWFQQMELAPPKVLAVLLGSWCKNPKKLLRSPWISLLLTN